MFALSSALPRTRKPSLISLKANRRQPRNKTVHTRRSGNPAPAPVAAAPAAARVTIGPAANIKGVPIRVVDIPAVIISEAEEATQ